MKKYNLSNIMKRAWELVKKEGLCISEGLKLAWKEAKNMKETMEEKLIRLGYKVWEKGDMKRIYINDFQKYCFRPLTGTLLSKHHPPILPPQAAFFAGLRGK